MASGYNHFSKIAENIKPACQKIVKDRALLLRDSVWERAPKRTHFMADSTYVVAPDGTSTYGMVSPSTKGTYLLPEVRPGDDTTAIVGVAANYGVFVEMGTRHMSPHPFFYNAVDANRAPFQADVDQFESLLARGIS
jgi:HK97 gp10 family phage protein